MPTSKKSELIILLSILLVIYATGYSWLIWSADGLPYVMDNNESFSSLWHAANLANYPFAGSFGLTDESYGTAVAAHPYVYTHQGNFPRLFAYLIYLLGVRSVEGQILVTTLAVGGTATALAYALFARIGSALFAFLCCIILISDYLLVAQWQVVTYRVWHQFFIFSSLLCVYVIGHRVRSLRWLVVANFACLYYYEFVFVAFVSLCSFFFAIYVHWGKWKRIIEFGLLIAAGGTLAILVLALQLIAYMGWDDFIRDTYLTFVARNKFQTDPTLLQEMAEFFDSRNIVFWYNLEDGSRFKTLGFLLASVTYYEFQIHTPFFTLITFVILAAMVVGWAAHYLSGTNTRGEVASVGLLGAAASLLAGAHIVHSFWRGSLGLLQLAPLVVGFLLWLATKVKSGRTFTRLPKAPRIATLDLVLWLLVPGVLLHQSFEPSVLGRYSATYLAFMIVYCSALLLQLLHVRLINRRLHISPLAAQGVCLLMIAAALVLIIKWTQDEQVLGLAAQQPFKAQLLATEVPLAMAIVAVVVALGFFWIRSGQGARSNPQQRSITIGHQLLTLTIFLLFVAALPMISTAAYHQAYVVLWKHVVQELAFAPLIGPTLVLAIVVGARIAMSSPARYAQFIDFRLITGVAAFLLAGLIAYLITFAIFAAYIFTGYRFRLAPFTVFHTDVLIGLSVLAVVGVSGNAFRLFREHFNRRGVRAWMHGWGAVVGYLACAIAAATLLALMATYWLGMQATYARLLPPNHYSVLSLLAKDYRYSTTITNTYAAPIAWATKNWSYLYAGTISGQLQKQGSRFAIVPDGTYMWFADKKSNEAYRRPEFYVCISNQAPSLAIQLLNWKAGIGERYRGCDEDLLVQISLQKSVDSCPPLRLRQIDDEGRRTIGYPRWAIIELDWKSADAQCNDYIDRFPIRPMLP